MHSNIVVGECCISGLAHSLGLFSASSKSEQTSLRAVGQLEEEIENITFTRHKQ